MPSRTVPKPHLHDKYQLVGKLDDNFEFGTTWLLNRDLTPLDRSNLSQFCTQNELTVTDIDSAKKHVQVKASSKAYSQAFGSSFSTYNLEENSIFVNDSDITIPSKLDFVSHIFGFNNIPAARPFSRRSHGPHEKIPVTKGRLADQRRTGSYSTPSNIPTGVITSSGPYFPTDVARFYNFPTNYNGSGQTIGIIELGGGYLQSDLDIYFSFLGISPQPTVTWVSVDGAVNNPGVDLNVDQEVALDIQVAGSISNGSNIVVYFAPNTSRGFYDAFDAAINDTVNKPQIISCSWGSSELFYNDFYGPDYMPTFSSLLKSGIKKGINIFCASGDRGSQEHDQGTNVVFPASSPYNTACGGTQINTNGDLITVETVWNDEYIFEVLPPLPTFIFPLIGSGGGYSTVFKKPKYQCGTSTYWGRGIPDISAVAIYYWIYVSLVDPFNLIAVSGTSAVAPLLSGLFTNINQANGGSVGFINPLLYKHGRCVCNDIIDGTNGAFRAREGWDACTGFGSPKGEELLRLFTKGKCKKCQCKNGNYITHTIKF